MPETPKVKREPWDHLQTAADALGEIRRYIDLDRCESDEYCNYDHVCRIHKIRTILSLFDKDGQRVRYSQAPVPG